MSTDAFPAPSEGILLTHFVVVSDIARSREFYAVVLGGEVVLDGDQDQGIPAMVKLANSWIIVNIGGGPTEDKPEVTLDVPADPHRTSAFLNIRVADIQSVYEDWSSRGARFLTPPQDRGAEIRCYVRDPDGHLIEVGQSTGVLEGGRT
jgi:catechol 2,3-dioxygenase-like lactoylglutathione lyase family enzyme